MEEETEQPHNRADLYRVTDEPAYLQIGEDEKPAISAEPMPDLRAPCACSFCKQAAEHLFGEQYPRTDNTGAIIDGVWICDACVVRFAGFLAQERSGTVVASPDGDSGLAVPGRPIRRPERGGVRARRDRNTHWSALGPHGSGNPGILAGASGHDGYEEIAGRTTFPPMTSVARPTWRRLRVPHPDGCRGPVALANEASVAQPTVAVLGAAGGSSGSPRGSLVAMAVPPLTRRGFWWRAVVSTITLLCYLWIIFMLVRRHWLGAAVLIGVLGLFPLGSLIATFWRKPRRHSA